MVRTAFPALLFASASLLLACESDAPSGPAGPSGPLPGVLVDVDFGEPPVAGTLRIVPGTGTVGWRYRVEAIPPGTEDRTGDLDAAVAFPYRFDSPGVHMIRVELTGPDGPVVIWKPIVVYDPASDFEVLAKRRVDEIWPEAEDISPEGIVLDPDGRWLYAANYRSGELVRIDPGTLAIVDRVLLEPQVEGLAVTPGGSRLFAIHKNAGLSVVDLGSFTARHFSGFGGYFIQALDDVHALIGGGNGLELVNVDTRETDRASIAPGETHFSVFPDANRVVAVLTPFQGNPSLEIFSLPDLDPVRSIPLGELPRRRHVAVDPSEDVVYVFASGSADVRFLAVNPATGDVLTSTSVSGGGCLGYCVANPVVSFGSGRYVAFELGGAVSVVDTALDLPRYIFDPEGAALRDGYSPSGVAADPDSDILYVLGPTDRLFKLRLRTP